MALTVRRKAALALACVGWLALSSPGRAVQPDEMLTDPALESRARALSLDLRCLVCQNQSIDDSNAPLARDLRVLVRERLRAGDSDDRVVAYLTDRYGDFVRLKPPFQPNTWLLWLGPFAVLLAGGAGVALHLRQRRRTSESAPPPLSDAERERLRQVLGGEG